MIRRVSIDVLLFPGGAVCLAGVLLCLKKGQAMSATGTVLDETKVDTVITEIPISFTRRRYGQQWFCWVSYHNGCGWDVLGDSWQKFRPSNATILQALEAEGLYVGAVVKARGMLQRSEGRIESIDRRAGGEYRYWLDCGGCFDRLELEKR